MKDKQRQLDEVLAERKAWRAKNVTGKQLSQSLRDEVAALDQRVAGLQDALGRELMAEVCAALPPIVLASDDDSVNCRIPKDVLRQLLILHDAGLGDRHFAMALDDDLLAKTFAVVLELNKHTA